MTKTELIDNAFNTMGVRATYDQVMTHLRKSGAKGGVHRSIYYNRRREVLKGKVQQALSNLPVKSYPKVLSHLGLPANLLTFDVFKEATKESKTNQNGKASPNRTSVVSRCQDLLRLTPRLNHARIAQIMNEENCRNSFNDPITVRYVGKVSSSVAKKKKPAITVRYGGKVNPVPPPQVEMDRLDRFLKLVQDVGGINVLKNVIVSIKEIGIEQMETIVALIK